LCYLRLDCHNCEWNCQHRRDSDSVLANGTGEEEVEGLMTQNPKEPVSIEELLVSSLAQTDVLAKLLIDKGIITQKVAEERATYQAMLRPTSQ